MKLSGPLHTNVGLPALVVVVSTVLFIAQLTVPLLLVTVGGTLFPETVVAEVCVQPLDESVTLSVYVPAAFTVGARVPAPEVILPPLLAVHR